MFNKTEPAKSADQADCHILGFLWRENLTIQFAATEKRPNCLIEYTQSSIIKQLLLLGASANQRAVLHPTATCAMTRRGQES